MNALICKLTTRLDSNRWFCILFFLVTGSLFLALTSPFTSPLNEYCGHDTGIFMIMGKGVTRGYVLFRDLFDHKGPFAFLLPALALTIANGKLGMFILQSLLFAVDLTIIYKTARLYVGGKSALLANAVLLYMYCGTVMEGCVTEEWSLPFLLLPLYLSLRHFRRGGHITLFPLAYSLLIGVSLCSLVMLRAINAAPICGIVLACTIMLLRSGSYTLLLRHAAMVLAGVAVVMAPLLIYFWANDAVDDFIFSTFTYNHIYAIGGLHSKSASALCRITWRLIHVPVFLYLCCRLRRTRAISGEECVLAMCVCLLPAPMMYLGISAPNYYMLCISAFILSPVFLRLTGQRKALLAMVLILAPFCWTAMLHVRNNFKCSVLRQPVHAVATTREIMEHIPAEDRDKVWSYGYIGTNFCLYADVTPCYKYFFFQENFENSCDMVKSSIDSLMTSPNPPKYIVMDADHQGYMNATLRQALRDEYTLVHTTTGTYEFLYTFGSCHLALYRRD